MAAHAAPGPSLSAFRKLPITTSLLPSGVASMSLTPMEPKVPLPLLLWRSVTPMFMKVWSIAPVVALTAARPWWVKAAPPAVVKKPPSSNRLPALVIVLISPFVGGALKLVTTAPVLTSRSARWLAETVPTLVNLPAM